MCWASSGNRSMKFLSRPRREIGSRNFDNLPSLPLSPSTLLESLLYSDFEDIANLRRYLFLRSLISSTSELKKIDIGWNFAELIIEFFIYKKIFYTETVYIVFLLYFFYSLTLLDLFGLQFQNLPYITIVSNLMLDAQVCLAGNNFGTLLVSTLSSLCDAIRATCSKIKAGGGFNVT